MPRLTEDMTRLSGEIVALRSARSTLLENLRQGARDLQESVSEMRTGFVDDLAGLRRAWSATGITDRSTFPAFGRRATRPVGRRARRR